MATSGNKSAKVTDWDTLKFVWEEDSQSINNNNTVVAWELQLVSTAYGRIDSSGTKPWNVTVNGTKYSGNVSVAIANNTTRTLASGKTTIAHNSDGTKTFSYSFSQSFSGITFSGKALGTVSGSGSGTLDTIPRKSTLAASNGTLGTAQTLNVTRHSTSFTHTITYKCGTASGTICTKSSDTSISWTPPLSLANQNTTGTSVSVTFTITTYNGSTSLGSNTKTITCSIPASVKPSVERAFFDEASTAVPDGLSVQVKGVSKLSVQIQASGAYGSTIKKISSTIDGRTYTGANFTTNILTKAGSIDLDITVTDSRGRTATSGFIITVLDYTKPTIEATVSRCNSDGTANRSGTHLAVKFDSKIIDLYDQNTATYTVKYKKTTENEYGDAVPLTAYQNQLEVSGGVYIFPADASSSYDIVITATDEIDSFSKALVGKSIFKTWSIFKKGLGWAFGKIAELEGVLDIGFQTRFFGGILHMVLEPNTDLNDVRTPNTYVGANVSTYNYANCPLTTGTFTLEVVGMGEEGQVKQKLAYCHKTASRTWERIYYQGTWGEWICVSDFDGQLLWSGGYYMTSGHTIALAEPVSKQKSGIVLIFSEYVEGEAQNSSFHCRFIPKMMVSQHAGSAQCIQLSTSNLAIFATKYLYISDAKIVGHDNNGLTGTGTCGITYTNNRFILRYVIGV